MFCSSLGRGRIPLLHLGIGPIQACEERKKEEGNKKKQGRGSRMSPANVSEMTICDCDAGSA